MERDRPEMQRDRDRACTISLPNTPDAPFPHTLENPLPFRFHVEFNSERGNKHYKYHLVYILVKVEDAIFYFVNKT